MSKAVMLSIRPKWCEKIASGSVFFCSYGEPKNGGADNG